MLEFEARSALNTAPVSADVTHHWRTGQCWDTALVEDDILPEPVITQQRWKSGEYHGGGLLVPRRRYYSSTHVQCQNMLLAGQQAFVSPRFAEPKVDGYGGGAQEGYRHAAPFASAHVDLN